MDDVTKMTNEQLSEAVRLMQSGTFRYEVLDEAAFRLLDKDAYLRGCTGSCPCLSRPPIKLPPQYLRFDDNDQ